MLEMGVDKGSEPYDELELMQLEQEREEKAAVEAAEAEAEAVASTTTTNTTTTTTNTSGSDTGTPVTSETKHAEEKVIDDEQDDEKTGDLIPYTIANSRDRGMKVLQTNVYTNDEYDRSINEPHVYESSTSPQFIETRALFIGNLTSPFSNKTFKSQLNEIVGASEGAKIERLWVNRTRTHAYVLVNNSTGAALLKEKLNDKWFTSLLQEEQEEYEEEGTKRHKLFVEFIPNRALAIWIDQEAKSPKTAIWKVNYSVQKSKKDPTSDEEVMVANHRMLNYPNRTMVDYKSSDNNSNVPYQSSQRYYSNNGNRNGRYKNNYYDYNGGYDDGQRYHQNPYAYQGSGYDYGYYQQQQYYSNYNSGYGSHSRQQGDSDQYHSQRDYYPNRNPSSSYRSNRNSNNSTGNERREQRRAQSNSSRSRSKSPSRNKPLSPEWAT